MFGHVLKRDKKQLIDEIRQKFNDRKGWSHACILEYRRGMKIVDKERKSV